MAANGIRASRAAVHGQANIVQVERLKSCGVSMLLKAVRLPVSPKNIGLAYVAFAPSWQPMYRRESSKGLA
ncbi:hypothetical protein JNM87_02550 [Candidatus Saccharibacteria bacterium]|nr:hypothetical protein [Candidatus Saccharibacteria bacterium]